MRSARRVMSSRLPIGVPTRYKQPRAVLVSVAAIAVMLKSLTCGAEALTRGDRKRRRARALRHIANHIGSLFRVLYFFVWCLRGGSCCATVRIQMPEMRPTYG